MSQTEGSWQCPAESTIRATAWVEAQPQEPIEPFRQKTSFLFEWLDAEPVTESAVDAAIADALGEEGFRVRARYRTATPFGNSAPGFELMPRSYLWEHWLSDDGITSADVLLDGDAPRFAGFETRFEGGMLVHGADASLVSGRERYLLTGDPVADYLAHRARAQERVEGGEVALSIAEPADREAFWRYYAHYMSGEALADTVDQAAALSGLPNPSEPPEVPSWVGPVVASAVGLGLLSAVLGWMFGSLDNYRAWLAVWWPIIAVSVMPHALIRAAVKVFEGHLNHLDQKYPDALDEHAGFWLKERIAAANLAGEVEVGKAKEPALAGLDAYLPLRDKIVLGHKTYDKQDPTFWAIAAHELGHALDFRARPRMMAVSLWSRQATRQFLYWANAALLANMFLGWAPASVAWYVFLVGALLSGAVVLVDEALASRIGLRILGEDARIDAGMIKDLRRHLGLAFATYCAPLVAVVGMLAAGSWITTYVETHAQFTPADPLHPGRTNLGNMLSIVVLVAVVLAERKRAARWWARLTGGDAGQVGSETRACPVCNRRFPSDVERCPEHDVELAEQPEGRKVGVGCLAAIVGVIAAASFFLEVWDQPLGPWYRAAVLAYVPIVMLLLTPALAPVTLAMNLPIILVGRLMPKPPRETTAQRAPRAAADIVAEVQVADPRQAPPWFLDASPGLLLYALPLLIMWWASQL